MSRNLIQRFSVYRGHHGASGNPDESTVGVPAWTTSLAAADVYAREPSVQGMTPEAPTVSHRIYNAEMPAVFETEEIDVGYELGEVLGVKEDDLQYIAEKYGATASVWELSNDPVVRSALVKSGVDAIVAPETLATKPRFDDGEMEGDQITTFRSLGAEYGDNTEQESLYLQDDIFTGERTDVAAKWHSKLVSDALKPAVPEGVDPGKWDQATKYLLPKEAEQFRSKQGAVKFADLLDELPSVEQFGAAAFEGVAKKGWYRKSAQALKEVFGVDTRRFAYALAALSPQTSVESNLRNTLNVWLNWERAGRPQDHASIMKILDDSVEGDKGAESVLPAWRDNVFYALTEERPVQLSGAKVSSFAPNLLKEVERVTNDAWVGHFADWDPNAIGTSNLAGAPETSLTAWGPGAKNPRSGAVSYDRVPKKKGQAGMEYLALSTRMRETADWLTELTGSTWTPMEVQETVWSWTKALWQEGGKVVPDKLNPLVAVNAQLTDDIIRDVPDFGALLSKDNEYSQLLKEANYAQPTAGSGRRSPAGTITPEADRAFGTGGRAARTAENIRRIEGRRRRIRQSQLIEGLRFSNPGEHKLIPRRGGRGFEEVQYDKGGNGGDAGRPRVLGTEPIASYQPTKDFGAGLENSGASSTTYHEVVTPQRYHEIVSRVAQVRPTVYAYTADEYASMRTFVTEDGNAGFAIKEDGDIVSVFNAPGSEHKAAGYSMVRLAVELGGTKLDAFDVGLPEIYSQNGFKVVGKEKWSDEFAPVGWQNDKHLSKKPDIIFMEYDPKFHARPKKGLRNELKLEKKD